MGLHRQSTTSQGNTIEQYTMPVPLPQRQTRSGGDKVVLGELGTAGEPSWVELLAAIQGFRVALEGKIETVVVEVSLLWADLRKVSEKVKVAEGFIVEFQTEVGSLRKQMVQVNSTVRSFPEIIGDRMDAHLIWAGDNNCILDGEKDRFPPRLGTKPVMTRSLVEVMHNLGLWDAWRVLYMSLLDA
ncbi:hypothetical protein NDU88_007012 [Pleurodeles waltl]|uniref:Uncharacterized protein n=1 Tax=Pleurodeles waltl TaxID=8319 RepID=A0AAV7N576_PLEWA|nr:hypothetical protein NDU88_007012 [Pleurodeles waltl]